MPVGRRAQPGDLQRGGAADLGDDRVAVFVQRPAVEHLRAALQPGGRGGGVEAGDLGAAAHRHAGDGGEGQTAMALVDQVLGGQPRRREVVGRHVGDARALPGRRAAVVADDDHAALDRRLEVALVGERRDDDDTAHAVGEQVVEEGALLGAIAVGAADHQRGSRNAPAPQVSISRAM